MSRYIDAEYLTDTIGAMIGYGTTPTDIWDMVSKAPSIDIDRPQGKWNFIGNNMFECSQCGVSYTTQQLDGLRNYSTDPFAPNFCPNCGSDNRERRADDDV